MAKNWGRTPVTNADKRALTQATYLVDTSEGTEERIDRRPMGKVERFVDKEGNVVQLQLAGDGDPRRHETEIRMRAQYHKKGHVEFAKCPVKHGTRNSSTIASKDFAKLEKLKGAPSPHECAKDPKVMERRDGDLYAVKSCPHIEALIAFRVQQAAEAYAKRNAHQADAAKREAEKRELDGLQLEMVKEQLAERRARKPKAKDAIE